MQIILDLPESVVASLASVASDNHMTFDLLLVKLAQKYAANPTPFGDLRVPRDDIPYSGKPSNNTMFSNFEKQAQSFRDSIPYETPESELLVEEYDELPDYTPLENDDGEIIL